LILDNAPSHLSEDKLNFVNENFKILFLPPNVTVILQPMDQGIIEQTKQNYYKKFAVSSTGGKFITNSIFKKVYNP